MCVKLAVLMEPVSNTHAAKSMRRKADNRREQGWKRNSFWLTPEAVDVLDRTRKLLGLDSREATINVILERIGTDMFLQQEFLSTSR
jgi:hypothetical protein